MNSQKEREDRMREMLDSLADVLVLCLLERDPSLSEGSVMTIGPPPYRRVDADNRALCYIRSRPRKACVRVEVSGLWVLADEGPNLVQTASGFALLLRGSEEVEEVVTCLLQTVATTRARQKAFEASALEATRNWTARGDLEELASLKP